MIRSTMALGLLVAFVLSACGNPPSPSPSATPSPSPSASVAPSSAPVSPSAAAACVAADLAVTGGPWGGAAGSRGSDVIVENVGPATCALPAAPTVALVDQGGTPLLTSSPAAVGTGPELAPGVSTAFSLVLGNWCEQGVSLPLHFRLALASDGVDVGQLAVQTVDDLPPCNGPDQPATLSATGWAQG